jgi:hypothetical protein
VKWSTKLQALDFQEIMMFLQAPPTREWTHADVDVLLAEAFLYKSFFGGSAAHLRGVAAGTARLGDLGPAGS